MAYIILGIFIIAVTICVLHFHAGTRAETRETTDYIMENPFEYEEVIRLIKAGHSGEAKQVLFGMEEDYSTAKITWQVINSLLQEGKLDRYYQIDMSAVDRMTGMEFERFVANLLYRSGFANVALTPGSNDQGVDIVAEKDGVWYAFQCKCYTYPLNNKPIQEVTAGKAFWKCEVGVVVTNSFFNQNAIDVAEVTGTELWDRHDLMKRLAEVE